MEFLSLLFIRTAWNKIWPFLIAILFFGLIIFIHEFGHFIFAKLFKVKVNEFAIGMGPTIFSKQGKETKYALRLFPIGGFVSMEGEDEESEDEGSFSKKAVWKRMIIVSAGAIFNLILGLIICCVILGTGDKIGTTQIHSFYENAVSQESGLKPGDKILKIDGKRVYSSYDLSFLMTRSGDGVMDFLVERDGEKVQLNDVKFQTEKNGDMVTIIYDFIIVGVKTTPLNAIKYSFGEAASIGRMVYLSLFDLITGQYGLSDLSGPVGTVSIIADVAQESAANFDWSYLLTIMALITINIGLFNLLPVPALDGGRLFFMFIELIFRKPVPAKYENWIHAAGLFLLFAFMIVISFSDIWKLIQGESFV